eukprot:TRINITY_DN76977_c0_g1_i1.p1 TRINITY_DN76977_c0_g1~~TRINITY_DN76977_c0_g1_i1.p1  ORF type:complete len:320 (-),score=39.87 TRINITY_DN76977_c0_g1_i1:208-1167(-)
MHLLIIRHGQSANNVLEALHGCGSDFDKGRSVDPPLSDLGKRQAKLLGTHLGAQLRGSRQRVRLICSSMTRAMQTIEPLSLELGISPMVHPDVLEVQGFYSTNGAKDVRGLGKCDLKRRFPGFDVDAIPESGQGTEDCHDALSRAARVVAMLRSWADAEADEEKIVVLVSHNDFICLLARELVAPSASKASPANDIPQSCFNESYWPMNNTGISHFVIGVKPPAEAYQVGTYFLYWNRSDHLPERARSGVQFKNIGFGKASEWARVGEGGSGLQPSYRERETVELCGPSLFTVTAVAGVSAVSASLVVAAAMIFVRRRV